MQASLRRRVEVLAAALLSSSDDGARLRVVGWRWRRDARMAVRKEVSAQESLQIAIDDPFVRFVTGLIAWARRDLKFCAE
jgi:hypothetical protein